MKKIIALLLALLMIFTLSACGKEEEKDKTAKATIDSYAEKGEIPEIKVSLGTTVDKVKEVFPAPSNDVDEENKDVLLGETEGTLAVCLETFNASFYYEKANIEHGISVIAVTGGSVFGLELGNTTTKSDITSKLEAKYTESIATPEQQYFLPGYSENCQIISATFGKIRLDFFLSDGFLIAATLTNTEYWTD